MEETAFVLKKTKQKGKLSMDPMVESSWKPKDYSALVEQTISLVGKSTGMLEVTSGGFTPQISRVWTNEVRIPTMILWQ